MLDRHLIAETRPLANEKNILIDGNRRVTVLSERLFRIEESADNKFCDSATQAVWFRDMAPVTYTVRRTATDIRIVTAAATLVLTPETANSYVVLNGKKVGLDNAGNLLGTFRTLDCCDGSSGYRRFRTENQTEFTVKFDNGVASRTGVAVYDDTQSLCLLPNGMIGARDDDKSDRYIFAFGHDYRAAVRALYMITGQTPLIPRYALGNWWSRYHAYSEKEYLHLLDRFATRHVPFTVATVDMDWHWSTTLETKKHIKADGKNVALHGVCSGWTGYSWNTDLFPDYRRFLREIRRRNLHTTLNLHPAEGVQFFEDQYPEMAATMGIDPTTEAKVPFDMTNDRFINAYFKILHKPFEHDGVDFWWIDWQQGTTSALPGLDPLWALNHYHFLDNGKEHLPLILSRYSGIGSHRYPLGFSGDTFITWKTLAYLPYFTANATNVGYTWWSHDIGGHMFGIKDDELYARFIQLGVFSPINRLHGTSAPITTKEPDTYMNGKGEIAEEYLRLRHQMIPFLYSASYETTENGNALIEPMYYAYPEEPRAYRVPNQFLFGGCLMVSAVTKPGDKEGLVATRTWLPAGHWTDIFTGDEYDGNCEVDMVRWINTMPTLAREGAFFVLDTREGTNDCGNPDSLTVQVYNGCGTYTLHEDKDGERADTVFTSVKDGLKQTVTIAIPTGHGSVDARDFRLEFRNIIAGKVTVTKNGGDTDYDCDDAEFVSVTWKGAVPGDTYTVTVDAEERDARKWRNNRLLYAFKRVAGDIFYKTTLYREIVNLDDAECRRKLEESDFPRNAKKRLLEQM